ncbi:hypothetical protein B0J15DRAFT_560777 [Fusarium solani]|uniref:DUF7730 domain-containing protein n=1 Tax=Fusarium solani TaxID=169388 RepID=A0A9P9H9E2_FUSSL|nr:uncharacterized protein B0J15DRAFT_560777 [Fusarium solani]KAH7253435.1 hypothetical protein B0J15DRAFT_560777 [Fusarium solani]
MSHWLSSSEPQSGAIRSRLLLAPAEIRHIIYEHLLPHGIHVFRQGAGLCCSACVGASGDDEDGSERQTTGDSMSDTVWARRLASSWGPHWLCEELALSMDKAQRPVSRVDLAIAFTCKQLYFEVLQLNIHNRVLHVTDLDVLIQVLQKPDGFFKINSQLLSPLASSILCFRELHLTLRLPPTNTASETSPDLDESIDAWGTQAAAWLHLASLLSPPIELRRLHIWLDHQSDMFWSIVDERTIMSVLEPLTTRADMDISVSLPKIQHGLESHRHLLEQEEIANFGINRREMQRYYVDQNLDEHDEPVVGCQEIVTTVDDDIAGLVELERLCYKGQEELAMELSGLYIHQGYF